MSGAEVSNAEILFPGAIALQLGTVPDAPEAWAKELPRLTHEWLGQTGLRFLPVAGARDSVRTPDSPIPQRINELFPHKDLMLTGSLVGTVVTGVVCVEASGPVPGLELVDTSALFDEVRSQGIFESYGIDSENLGQYCALFSHDSFFSIALKRAAARLEEESLDKNELALIMSMMKPAPLNGMYQDTLRMPLLEKNPFSGNFGLCVDGGERFIGIQHKDTGELLPQGLVEEIVDMVIATTDPRTKHIVTYKPGKAVLFVREGTIHRGLRGSEGNRVVRIGRIATNPQAHEWASKLLGSH